MSVAFPQPTDINRHDFSAANSGSIDVPFVEVTPKSGAVSKLSLGYGLQGNQSTRTYLVYFNDTEDFIRQACGYPIRLAGSSGGGVNLLSRRLPIRDPLYPWLTAARAADVQPYGAMLAHHEGPFGPYPEYEYSHVTILFEAADWDILDDTTLQALYADNEARRFTSIQFEYGGEFLTRQTGSFKFVEGTPAITAPQFPQPKGMFEAHARFVLRWTQLPEIGILNSNKLLNANIREGKGKVNAFDWPVPEANGGYAAGTLLLEDLKLVPSMAPVTPVILGLFGFNPPRVYDLLFVMDWFDPPLGITASTRGHNAFPWAKNNLYYAAGASGYSGGITNAVNAAPIQITAANHGLTTGETVDVTGVQGNTAANGVWQVTVVDVNNFTLNGSIGNGAYVASTGSWGGHLYQGYDFSQLFLIS